jgi:hypothetical protein
MFSLKSMTKLEDLTVIFRLFDTSKQENLYWTFLSNIMKNVSKTVGATYRKFLFIFQMSNLVRLSL